METEEGEIEDSSSSAEELDIIESNCEKGEPTTFVDDYNVLHRPKLNPTLLPAADNSNDKMITNNLTVVQNSSNYRHPKTLDFDDDDGNDSDLKSKSDSSSSDSDSDYAKNSKKKRMHCPSLGNNSFEKVQEQKETLPTETESNNPFYMPYKPTEESISGFSAIAKRYQEKRKVNNVWSNVMVENQFAENFNSCDVDGKQYLDRGSESYVRVDKVENVAQFRKRKHKRKGKAKEAYYESESDSIDSVSSVSSGGLSDYTSEYFKNEESTLNMDLNQKAKRYQKIQAARDIREGMKTKMLDMDKKKLATFIGRKLAEDNIDIIEKTINILGNEESINKFFKTLKIERLGGVLIKNRTRRRTPGGTFLYLVRNDKSLPKERVDLIFDETNIKNIKKRVYRAKKKHEKEQAKEKESNMT